MTPKERARLRGLANGIDTVLQIGKDGIGENLIRQADMTLEARELIKGRVLDGCMDYTPRTAAEALAQATGSEVVQVIGSKFVLYRKKEETPAKRAETPKKHAKPCQHKRAGKTEAHARPDKKPSTPKHGGPRKPSTENRGGPRNPLTPSRNGQSKAPNRNGQGRATERNGSRRPAAPNCNGQGKAPNRNGQGRATAWKRDGNHGGNNRPTRAGKNRK